MLIGMIVIGLAIAFFTRPKPIESAPNQQEAQRISSESDQISKKSQSGEFLDKVKQGQEMANSPRDRNVSAGKAAGDDDLTVKERFAISRSIAASSKIKDSLQQIGTELAETSPEMAKEFVEEILNGPASKKDQASHLVESFMKRFAEIDPRAALDWAAFLPEELRLEAYNTAVRSWLQTDTPGVVDLIGSLPDGAMRADLISVAFGHFETIGVEDAAYWAENLAQYPDSRPHLGMIGHLWSRADIQSAYDWASSVEDPSAQTDAFSGITSTLMESSPAIAEKWIAEFPADNGIQQHSRYMVLKSAGEDGNAAFQPTEP